MTPVSVCRLHLLGIAILCAAVGAFAQDPSALNFDDYVTGMTVVGKPGSDPTACPPLVAEVAPDTPAAKAGVKPGDRLLAVDGHKITGILQARPLLHTKDPKPSMIELEGQNGPYTVTLGRIRDSVLLEREGQKRGPEGQWFPKDATEAEMQRVMHQGPEPPRSEVVFPGHYPSDPDLYFPGFEVFVWKAPQPMTIGGIEDGPAQKAGAHYGDEIVSVNGVNPRGKSMAELEQLFGSPKPAIMTLVVDRDGTKKTFTFELAKASDVAAENGGRMYKGSLIPAATPTDLLHCFDPPPKDQ